MNWRQDFEYQKSVRCPCSSKLGSGFPPVIKHTQLGAVHFLKCPECGSYIQSPILSANSLAAWYDSDSYQGGNSGQGAGYIDYKKDEGHRFREAKMRCQRDILPHLAEGTRVLEIGCASAAILAVLKNAGHHVLGCDLSVRFADMARSFYDVCVQVTTYLEMEIEDESLDAILMFGTFSNLQNLPECLERMRRQLKPSGRLIFNFPAADSFTAMLYGSRYWMFTPSVMQFMTRKGVVHALTDAGFSVEWLAHDVQAPSLSKVLGHAGLARVYPIAEKLGILNMTLPTLPIPGVYGIRARPK